MSRDFYVVLANIYFSSAQHQSALQTNQLSSSGQKAAAEALRARTVPPNCAGRVATCETRHKNPRQIRARSAPIRALRRPHHPASATASSAPAAGGASHACDAGSACYARSARPVHGGMQRMPRLHRMLCAQCVLRALYAFARRAPREGPSRGCDCVSVCGPHTALEFLSSALSQELGGLPT